MPIAHNDYLTRFNQSFEDGLINGAGAFTRFDGYRTDFGGGFNTGITVWLDPSWALGQGFEWSVAANGQDGGHQRDFIFHITRDTSTGDLLVAASNNTNGAPREDLDTLPDVAVIETAGWYTLQHDFHENDDGVLEVTLSVIDSDGDVVFSHVRSAGADLIATEVGGNRYGWVTVNTVTGGVAVDGVTLSTADTNPFTVHDGNTIEGSYATQEEAIAAIDSGAEAGAVLAVRELGVPGSTFVVNEGMSIQAAINAAAPGDTIVITAGVYTENLTISTNGLTIEAADGAILQGSFRTDNGITGSTAEFFETSEAYSNASGNGVTVSGDNVTITGLTISGFNTAVELGNGVDGLTLNNVDLSDGVTGIRKGTAAGVTDLTVNGGSISEFAYGMNFAKAVADGVGNINGFTVDGTSFFNLTEKGIYTETLLNALITNITMTDVGVFGRGLAFTPTTGGEHGAGIDINLKYETGLYTNIVIENFDFTNVGESTGPNGLPHNNAGAITIKQRDDGPSYNSDPADFIGSVIIRNGSVDGTSVGVRAGEAGKTVGGPSVTIENVSIDGALVGSVENLTTSPMSVEGTAGDDVIVATAASTGVITFDGAGGADDMTGGGGNDIFASDGDDTVNGGGGMDTVIVSDAAAAQSLTATNVELITDGAGTFYVFEGMSIQAAIDAASAGDTIVLGAGTFGENLIINEGVTILGANAGVDGGPGERGAESFLTGMTSVNAASPVVIDGVTVSYDGSANGAYNAVYLMTAGHTLTNSRFVTTMATANFETRAIFMGPQASGEFTISDNYFGGHTIGDGMFGSETNRAAWNRGIWSDGGGVSLNITGNTFEWTRSAMNLDSFNSGTSDVSGNTIQNSGTGISVGGLMDGPAITGVHDNSFTNVGTDLNLQNIPGAFTFDADATNNVATDLMVIVGGTHGDTITGTEGADYIDAESLGTDTANPDNDILYGLGGDDTLLGKDGDDILIGGEGDDSLNGGLGDDVADYSDDTDGLVISGSGPSAISVAGGAGVGSDTLVAIERIIGGSGNDQFNTDRAEFEILASLTKESFALGEDGVWTITGDGVDTIDGGRVVHDLDGQTFLLVGGNSFASVEAALASGIAGTIVVGATPDPDPEVPADPIVVTFTQDDLAEDDDDIIEVVGTDAIDTVDITVDDNDGNTIIVTGNEATGEVFVDLDGDGQVDLTFSGIEEVVLNGSNIVLGGDFTGTGVSNDTIVMNGTSGNDTLDGSAVMSNETQEAYGYEGDDTISTAGGDDYVDAGEGSDTVNTGGGDDYVIGNIDGANDSYNGGAGNDTIDYSADTEGFNINLTSAGASGLGIGNDTAAGFENVIGGSGGDGLIGNGANNRLTGGLGDDDIRGLNGIDTAVINADAANGIANQLSGGRLIVETDDGSDVLRTVEFIEFNNATIQVNDVTGNAHAWGGADTDEAEEGENGDGLAVTGNVLDNDIEIEGEAVTVTGVAAGDEAANSGLTTGGVGGAIVGAYGALVLNADGSYSYVVTNQSLGAGETATDTFTYRVSDGEGGGDLTTITFTVSGENDAPTIVAAVGSAAVTESDMAVSDSGAIVFGDLDATDDLTVSDDSASTAITWDGGSLSMGQEAAIRAGFTLDNTSFDNSGTVNWTYSASAADLDFLAAGETVTFDVTVTVTDDSGAGDNSVTQVVSVTITGTNDAPTVSAISGMATDEDDTSYELNLLTEAGAADVDQTDVLSVANVTAASSNMDRVVDFDVDPETGAFSLDATQFNDLAVGESETVTVTYDVVDGNGGVTSNTATFVVNGVNDAPVGEDDSPFQMDEDTGGTIDTADLVANDTDDDTSDTLTVSAVAATSAGGALLTLNGDGTITYDSNGQFDYLAFGESTTDTFTYTVDDGNGGTDEATVTVTVNGVNDGPTVGAAVTATANEDDADFSADLLDGADDVDNDAELSVTNASVSQTGGTAFDLSGFSYNIDANGELTFDPDQFDSLGEDDDIELTFSYDVTDENGATVAQTAVITIQGENDDPEFVDPDATPAAFDENDNLVASGAFDFDGTDRTDAHTATAVLASATVSGGGSLTMAQQNALAAALTAMVNGSSVEWDFDASAANFDSLNPGQNVTATYTVTVDDGEGGADTRTVTVTINGDFENQTAPDGGGTVTGTNLADNITGSDDDDTINAGGGDNVVNAGSGDDRVTSGSGDDAINGGGGDDTIASGSGDDTIDGGAGDDDINAGSGNDLVFSSAGDDIVRGGSGNDTLSFQNAAGGIAVNLALTGFQTTIDGVDQYIGFENVIGSAFNDTITGNELANILNGGEGNDTLTGGLGADTLIGGNGNDTYFVDSLDTIVEEAGGGVDRIFTSAATFTLGGNIENIYGQSAAGHTFTGDDGANTMVGAGGNDVLIGGLGADTLLGQAGNDIMYGGTGAANTMIGGLGDDTYYVDANDSIVETAGQGTDTVITTRNTFTLNANVENLSFNGAGDFTGTGNVLNNVITGGAGNDVLMGGAGNDTLNGGDGIDVARVSGLAAGYSVTREGDGWRIVDTNLADGDDGSDFVMNMETLRFGNGATMSLAIMDSVPVLTADKGGYDGPQVLPGLSEDDFVFSKFDDTPLVLPGSDGLGDSLFGALELSQPALQENLLVRDGFMDQLLPDDGPAFTGRHDDWMI